MRKIYLNIFIGIIVILWFIYFIQTYTSIITSTQKKKTNEGFTPKINSLYRQYVRNINQNYEEFVNNYGPNIIMNKIKKWNIFR